MPDAAAQARSTLRALRRSVPGLILVRLVGAGFVLWMVATLTFFAVRLIPGDPAEAILGGPGSQTSPAALAAVRAEYGLDLPVFTQYLAQLGRLVTGDLGRSYALNQDVAPLLAGQLGGTLLLAVLALAVAWLLALVLATWSTRGGRFAWFLGSGLEIVSAALPHFWLATALIVLFSVWLGWLPPVSTAGPAGLVLPVLTLAVPLAGFLGQIMRESLLAALESPFVLSARARGEGERGIRWVHALRHAALPAISLSGWAFGSLISGAVVVETIFARPGLGRTLLNAVTVRDVPVVVGTVLVVALGYILMTLLTDLAQRLADPRLRTR
ncbi:ABC transporter permease [Cryobacterium sp. TMT1-21]|uniref:ABC transporter permease n=1 Tax=Cryobacterium shii TaxID=1259235 RepID=A0AAQ2C4S9_9MICO|nr:MULTISPECIES: ABC transporter permease [Cryobacterium]TFC43625.1 ABC transporter permease [Cryobacterium shii]TFC85997.1 ABC transporter permease [Cryobacterium sp. TmT2-59]TFD13738.1 ABC transporter permease [Cryobacterium sp. TMT4-10]TFD15897.1 ABC transporter permease [Cryobacterium sp. TMT1-21]TFD19745.1 ABC transporter permease [Cryobacterium sp. TMT2-23]